MNPEEIRPANNREELYAQACRDGAFIWQHLKRLPWNLHRREQLDKLIHAAEGLLSSLRALREDEER